MFNSHWKPGMVAICVIVCLGCCFLGHKEACAVTGTADSGLFSINTRWTSGVENPLPIPLRDDVGSCYPNPFNPRTRIQFGLVAPASVDLKIYDLQGRLIRTLIAGELLGAGNHEADWKGRDARGAEVAAGVYIYRLVTDRFSSSRTMTLVK
jgi:hypothetical protein